MTDAIRIADELAHLEAMHVSKLREFQGNLKDLDKSRYDKLKRSVLKHGIFVPVFVWNDLLLDGHQRLRVALTEGWDIEWPIIRISADTEQEAKEKLLAISSQYGKITQEGWDEFTHDLDESWLLESTHFDALPYVFERDYAVPNFQPVDPSEQPRLDQKSPITCPHCNEEFVPD